LKRYKELEMAVMKEGGKKGKRVWGRGFRGRWN